MAPASRVIPDDPAMAPFGEDPLVLVEGDGVRIRDADGREYLDGMAGVFVSSLGMGTRA
jgi:adenosylmethionine-8-amino-7-oxononanoate aminotransferase